MIRSAALALVIGACLGVVAIAPVAAAPVGPVAGVLPVANDDAGSVLHGRTRNVAAPGVLGNDVLIGTGFSAELVNGPNHGSLDLDANGGYQYTADMDHTGTDQFRYRVDGGLLGLSNTATVRITVTNTVPVARADFYDAIADVEISVGAPGLMANDTDADGDELTVDVTSEPPHGNLNERDDGSFRYRADDDFEGVDTFRYRVWDGAAWSATVRVEITVTLGSSVPTATPSPTAGPTKTPTPTPTPNSTATPSPTTGPTARPSPTASPRPSATVAPSDRPTGSAPNEVPSGGASPLPSPSPSGSAPTGGAVAPPRDPGTPGDGSGGGPGGRSQDPTTGAAQTGPFGVPGSNDSEVGIDIGAVAFGGFDWAVPSLVLTVPGLLLMIAILAQGVIGLAWLPVVRRRLGGDDRSSGRVRVTRER